MLVNQAFYLNLPIINKTDEYMPTIGVDFKVRTLLIDGYQCKVQIWLVETFLFLKENLEILQS